MTDRELLEFAAKAAGPDIFGEPGLWFRRLAGSHVTGWNPLTNDGDALRLAVKLRMMVSGIGKVIVDGVHVQTDSGVCIEAVDPDGDLYAATRRAIVRAAAEIGKALP